MKELEIIKAFAELEGLVFIVECDLVMVGFGHGYEVYNPLLTNSLNCAARDKYETDIEWYYESVSMQSEYTDRPNEFAVRFSGKEELPKAVIECILKSEGKWKD